MKKAFTLAEVLIVLAVVGVVAALTMPNLIADINNKILEARFRTVHSDFTKRFDALYTEFPETLDDWAYARKQPGFTAAYTGLPLYSRFRTDLLKSKAFKDARNIPPANLNGITAWSFDNQKSFTYPNSDTYWGTIIALELPNGGLIMFRNGITFDYFELVVDTNGYKSGPNRAGFDLFYYYVDITDSKLKPRGGDCHNGYASATNGEGCIINALSNSAAGNIRAKIPGYWNNMPGKTYQYF